MSFGVRRAASGRELAAASDLRLLFSCVLPDLTEDELIQGAGEEASDWSVRDVKDFISGIGFESEAYAFVDQARCEASLSEI